VHVPSESVGWSTQREWAPLDELCIGIYDCPHSTPKLTVHGPLLARSQDIRSGVFRWDEAAHVSDETYEERIARAEPTFGDILYSREGTYFGIAADMPPATRVCLGQRMVLIRPDPAKVNPRFLRYWLNSPILASHIQGFRDGSVAERLNMPVILNLPVPSFPRHEQDAIAELLGSIDEKIELNRETSQTIEAAARATFNAWFVTFAPVRAKMEGAHSFVTMPQATFDQLPDTLVVDEYGTLPRGWTYSTVGAICEFNYGKALKADSRQQGLIPVYGSNGRVGWHDKGIVEGPGIVVGRKGNPGTVLWVSHDFYPIDTTFYVTAKSTKVILPYLRYALENLRLSNFAADSAVPGLNRNIAYGLPILVPEARCLESFAQIFLHFAAKVEANDRQSRTLLEIRDTLLPRLISGEVKVSDVGVGHNEGA
jgi:type I restriction enzyme, S subunit